MPYSKVVLVQDKARRRNKRKQHWEVIRLRCEVWWKIFLFTVAVNYIANNKTVCNNGNHLKRATYSLFVQ